MGPGVSQSLAERPEGLTRHVRMRGGYKTPDVQPSSPLVRTYIINPCIYIPHIRSFDHGAHVVYKRLSHFRANLR